MVVVLVEIAFANPQLWLQLDESICLTSDWVLVRLCPHVHIVKEAYKGRGYTNVNQLLVLIAFIQIVWCHDFGPLNRLRTVSNIRVQIVVVCSLDYYGVSINDVFGPDTSIGLQYHPSTSFGCPVSASFRELTIKWASPWASSKEAYDSGEACSTKIHHKDNIEHPEHLLPSTWRLLFFLLELDCHDSSCCLAHELLIAVSSLDILTVSVFWLTVRVRPIQILLLHSLDIQIQIETAGDDSYQGGSDTDGLGVIDWCYDQLQTWDNQAYNGHGLVFLLWFVSRTHTFLVFPSSLINMLLIN